MTIVAKKDQTVIEAFVIDLVKRAGSSAWQAASAVATVLWLRSGLHASDLFTASGLHTALTFVGAGAIGAGLSAAKTTALAFVKAQKGTLLVVAEDAGKAVEADLPKALTATEGVKVIPAVPIAPVADPAPSA